MKESELSQLPMWGELTGPRATSLKKRLRRAASFFTRQQIDEMIPVFREGGKLAANRARKRGKP